MRLFPPTPASIPGRLPVADSLESDTAIEAGWIEDITFSEATEVLDRLERLGVKNATVTANENGCFTVRWGE